MIEIPPTDAPQERLDRIRLIRSQNVGPVSFRQLLTRYRSAGAALEALPDLARKGGLRRDLRICSRAAAEREAESVAEMGGQHVFLGDPDYPLPLAAIPDAPALLSVLGDASLLSGTAIAVVGARNASTNGRRFAETLCRGLAAEGTIVVSGLARGIDAAAHAGALGGGTVAVLGGGVDIVYPKENEPLYHAIRDQGVLVSEMPPGTEPQARHFPVRNRIISGLSLGVVVVEAALRSGSLITARLAGEQGREVFAIPGSPLDPRARGANALIRNGATLVETADHILEGIQAMRNRPLSEADEDAAWEPAEADELVSARSKVVASLGPTPVAIDDLLRDTGLPAATVWTILLELELAGRLERQAGGRVALLV